MSCAWSSSQTQTPGIKTSWFTIIEHHSQNFQINYLHWKYRRSTSRCSHSKKEWGSQDPLQGIPKEQWAVGKNFPYSLSSLRVCLVWIDLPPAESRAKEPNCYPRNNQNNDTNPSTAIAHKTVVLVFADQEARKDLGFLTVFFSSAVYDALLRP